MAAVPEEPARRRGRRPATDSTETWCTILDVSRRLFAERGYSAVTNKELAAAAGITTSALYHYVESKQDLYVAVHRDVLRRLYDRFEAASAAPDTFLGKFEAMLEESSTVNASDPSLAQFIGTARIDMGRFPELAARLERAVGQSEQYFVDLIDVGVATGEIAVRDRAAAAGFVRVVLIGLTDGGSTDPHRHRCAVDGVTAALRGQLVAPPSR